MSLETDLIVDRRRLKRRLSAWRVVALLALVGCVAIGVSRWAPVIPHTHLTRLSVNGIITDDRKLVEQVTALGTDDSVRAVVLVIDSPGGSVAGGESLHAALVGVAARKPVVAVMRGTAASAGYMIAVPAARIFAREATLTGSIGVLLQTGEISGLLGKIGVTAEAITSGPLKDQPSVTRPMTPEGHEVLQGIVMDLYDQFVGMVASGRNMTVERVRALADGRAYTGRQALALGLIDEIGGEVEARRWLAADRNVPATLPIDDLQQRSLAERTFGSRLGGLLGGILQDTAKSLLLQGVKLDGAWAVWQSAMNGS